MRDKEPNLKDYISDEVLAMVSAKDELKVRGDLFQIINKYRIVGECDLEMIHDLIEWKTGLRPVGWCFHIVRVSGEWFLNEYKVPDSWKACPVCLKKRPQ